MIQLPVPKNLYAVIHHPLLEIKTSDSRGVLPKTVDLKIASEQLASIGGFVHSLHTADFDLMRLILKDYLVENYRTEYVPFFKELKTPTSYVIPFFSLKSLNSTELMPKDK